MDRTQELVGVVFGEFAAMNIGPGRGVPTKTIYGRVSQNGTALSEIHPALVWAVEQAGLLEFTPGGIADLGTLTLPQAGYDRSRA